MASVSYDHVWKKFGDFTALNDLNINIADKEFLVLVGPSGCGKTTALRCLAGLEEVSQGRVLIGDKAVNDVAPKDRDIAMVFQSYALYPHMTVFDNMAFGLKLRKVPKNEIKRRVEEAAQILGIEQLLKRKPRELSGGQRQRVAVGRAIVREPKVFLFDEPLSNLDAKLRVQTRAEISKLHQRLQTTFIYVTHDQVEAMTMATRIAVMNKGILQQLDTPQSLYDRPANLFVDTGAFAVKVPEARTSTYMPVVDKEVFFGIRPEDVHNPIYVPPGIHAELIDAKVDVTELMGNEIFLYMLSGNDSFVARVDPRTRFAMGDKVQLALNMDNFHIFDAAMDKENPIAVR